MSELIAKSSGEIRARNALLGYWWYEKSEADKVIAELETNLSEIQSQKMQLEDDVTLLRHNNSELKKACNDKDNWCLHTLKEFRHHKYKRCLAMARWCASRSANWCFDPADDELHKSEFYEKWKLRWRELAEKFKPNNSTAQHGKG